MKFREFLFLSAVFFTAVSIAEDLCNVGVYKTKKGELYAISGLGGQKAEMLSKQVDLSSVGFQRSSDCRWVVGFGTQLIDVGRGQVPVELGGLHNQTDPIFSPDSQWLVYRSPSDNAYYSIQLATMVKAKLASSHLLEFTKERMVFYSEPELRSIKLDGTDNVVIDSLNDFLDLSFAITPDGQQVFYTKPYHSEKRVEILMADITGANKKKIYEVVGSDPTYLGHQVHAHLYKATPDKKNLLFSAKTYEGGFVDRLLSLDISTGKASLIALGPQNVDFAFESPDFSRIFFTEINQYNATLFSTKLDGSGKVDLGSSYFYGLSKDGTRLLRTRPAGIVSSKLDGSDEIKLIDEPFRNRVAFNKEKDLLYALQADKDGFTQILSIDITSGTTKTVSAPMWEFTPERVAVSADGKTFFVVLPTPIKERYRLFGFNTETQTLTYLDELDSTGAWTLDPQSVSDWGG